MTPPLILAIDTTHEYGSLALARGMEVLEEIEMIEVKQGPYAGDQDKTRFDGITVDQVTIGEGSIG